MARRKKDNVVDVLLAAPWWTSLAVAAAVYLALRFVLPPLGAGNPMLRGLAAGGALIAPYLALSFAVLAPLAYLNRLYRRWLLDRQTSLESIRSLPWREFELLVGEGFRRLGYVVQEAGGAAPDGGIDLVLRKDGRTTIVQCKHWQTRHVGVKPMRELYGVMTAESADGAVFVTSGDYTPEARAFAEDKPIGLVNGPALVELIDRVRQRTPPRTMTQRREPTLRL